MNTVEDRFIVLEGIDGSGTTTVGKLLAEQQFPGTYPAEVVFTAEPSHGPVGRRLREYLQLPLHSVPAQTLALMFLADRADHVESLISPALARGAWVVCDRYLLSTLAYQHVPWNDLLALATRLPIPRHTFFLDVSTEEAARRRAQRGGRTEMYEVPDFQRIVAARYREAVDVCTRTISPIEHGVSQVDVEALQRFWRRVRATNRSVGVHKVVCEVLSPDEIVHELLERIRGGYSSDPGSVQPQGE